MAHSRILLNDSRPISQRALKHVVVAEFNVSQKIADAPRAGHRGREQAADAPSAICLFQPTAIHQDGLLVIFPDL